MITHSSTPRERAEQLAADLVVVKILKPNVSSPVGGYERGDLAGFDRQTAERLVRCGVASFDLNVAIPAEEPDRFKHNPSRLAEPGGGEMVRFLKPWHLFNVGEVAGVPADRAAELVRQGIAERTTVSLFRRTLRQMRDAIGRR